MQDFSCREYHKFELHFLGTGKILQEIMPGNWVELFNGSGKLLKIWKGLRIPREIQIYLQNFYFSGAIC